MASNFQVLLEQKKLRTEFAKQILEIVGELLDPVSEEILLQSCTLLCQQDYEDVTIERSITNLCGYPLCNNTLHRVPRNQFHISLKNKKVYDITERKRFCTNVCYKASKYLISQLPADPRWLRANDETTEVECPIRLLPVNENCGFLGEAVVFNSHISLVDEEDSCILPLEEKNPVVSVVCNEQLQQLASNMKNLNLSIQERTLNVDADDQWRKVTSDFKSRRKSKHKPTENKNEDEFPDNVVSNSSTPKNNYPSTIQPKSNLELKPDVISESTKSLHEEKMHQKSILGRRGTKQSPESHVKHVQVVLSQWVTTETMHFISGFESSSLEKEITEGVAVLLENDDQVHNEIKNLSELSIIKERNENNSPDENSINTGLNSKKAMSKILNRKMPDNVKKKTATQRKKQNSADNRVLPAIESLSASSARSKIIRNKFCDVFRDILPPAGIIYSNSISDAFSTLVNTFNVAPTNVVFKPAEQILMAVALLLVLSRQDKELTEKLRTASVQQFLNGLLSGFNITVKVIDEMVSEILKDGIFIFK